MATVTTRPDATVSSSGGTVTGAASRHAATSDDSDSSYVDFTSGDEFVLGFAEPSIPSGAVLNQVTIRIRVAKTGASNGGSLGVADLVAMTWTLFVNWTTATTVSLIAHDYDLYTYDASDVQVQVTPGIPTRCYELFADFTYVAKPTLNVTAPTGTVTDTNTPTVTWTETLDSDGGAQTKYEVKVFSAAQYGAGGFDPSTSTATYSSGTLSGSSLSHAVTTALADATYRAYVRVGQTVKGSTHWSDWDYEGFVSDATYPDTPSITLTAQASDGRIKVELDDAATGPSTHMFEVQVSRDGGTTWEAMRLLTDDDGRVAPASQNLVTNPSFETDTTGWSTSSPAYHINSGAVLTRQTPGVAQSGAYVGQIVTPGSAAAEGVAYAFSGYTFLAGTAYTLSMRVMANAATDVDLILGKASADAARSDLSLAAGTWTDISVTWTPAADGTAVYAVLRTDLAGSAVARTIQIDAVKVEAASSAGTYFEGAQPVTVYDYEAANGGATYYRARALHSYSGEYAVSSWVTAHTSWSSSTWWLKHPTKPAMNLAVVPYSAPGISRASRQGVFNVLGRKFPVVVDGVRGGRSGTLVLEVDTDEEHVALVKLLDETTTLLLQARSGHHFEDAWVRFQSQDGTRIVDKLEAEPTFESLPWVEVDRPAGVIEDWAP